MTDTTLIAIGCILNGLAIIILACRAHFNSKSIRELKAITKMRKTDRQAFGGAQ